MTDTDQRDLEKFKEYVIAGGGKSPYYPLYEAVKDTKHKRRG